MDRIVNLFRKKGQLLEDTMDGAYYQTLPVSFGVDYSAHGKPHKLSTFPSLNPGKQVRSDNSSSCSFSLGENFQKMGKNDPPKLDKRHRAAHTENLTEAASTSQRRQHFREGKTVSSPVATVSPMQSFQHNSPTPQSFDEMCTRRKNLHFKTQFVNFSTEICNDEKKSLINSDTVDSSKSQQEPKQSTNSVLFSKTKSSKSSPSKCSTSTVISQDSSKSGRKERKGGVAKLAKLLDKTGSFVKETSKCQTPELDKPIVASSSIMISEQGIFRPLATVEPLPLSPSSTKLLSPNSVSFVSSFESLVPCRSFQEPIIELDNSCTKEDSGDLLQSNTHNEPERKRILSTTCTIEVNAKDASQPTNEVSISTASTTTTCRQTASLERELDDSSSPPTEGNKCFTSSCKITFPMTRTNPVPSRSNCSSTMEPTRLDDPTIVPVTQRAQLFHSSGNMDNTHTSEKNRTFQVPTQRIELEEELQSLRKFRKVAFRNPAARMSLDVSVLAPLITEAEVDTTLPRSFEVAVLETLEFAKIDETVKDDNSEMVSQKESILSDGKNEEKPHSTQSSSLFSGSAKKLASYKQRRKTQPITIDDIAALNWKILMSEESSNSEDEEWRDLVQANKHS